MNILSIEASTSTGGVAILGEKALLGSVSFTAATLYSQRLLPSAEWLLQRTGLAPDQLGALAISRGPGSFTGLRIGLSAIKALAYAWKLPVVGVGTMEALALRASTGLVADLPVLVLLDARQGETFAGYFTVTANSQVVRHQADHVSRLEALAEWIKGPTIFAGDAVLKHEEKLRDIFAGNFVMPSPLRLLPSAEEVALLGLRRLKEHGPDDLMSLEPEYLRRSYFGA